MVTPTPTPLHIPQNGAGLSASDNSPVEALILGIIPVLLLLGGTIVYQVLRNRV
jgi:hypothetical protein